MAEMHHVVIIGGGFGGLYAAKEFRHAPVRVTLLDRRNFHLFQPLLYQVATGGLSPADIATPLREILRDHGNAQVLLANVRDIDVTKRTALLDDGEISYDSLIVACGNQPNYYGRDEWRIPAPGLKTIEDATTMRHKMLFAFEAAEREQDPARIAAWLTFVIVGGGATGVELAGALAEIAHDTLKREFRAIDPASARIIVVEGSDRILASFPAKLSRKAEVSLTKLGVEVIKNSHVRGITDVDVLLEAGGESSVISTFNVFWAAGITATSLATTLAARTGGETDHGGRLRVNPDLTVAGHPEIFIIGDAACFTHQTGAPLPGVAQVAIQQGRFAARLISRRLRGETSPAFRYRDYGTLAVIGRAAAVGDLGVIKISGYFAWLFWVFLHLMKLVGFDNRLVVAVQWAWNYFTYNRAARLITGNVGDEFHSMKRSH